MLPHANDIPQRPALSGFVRSIVVVSGLWGLLVPIAAYLASTGILSLLQGTSNGPTIPDLTGLLVQGGGYFAVALITVTIHALALHFGRFNSKALVLAMAAMFVISFLTGFTIGLFLLPSAFLLLMASIWKTSE